MARKNTLFKPVDMTQGTPWKQILAFMIPMLIGNVAQQLYNTVDSIVVGHYLGDNALAAVGSAGPIVQLLILLFVGIGTGATILVSQFTGAGDRENLSQTVGNCVILTFIASMIISVVGILLARPMLELLRTPAEIIDWCTLYLRVLLSGAIGFGFYNILCGVLRGMGDSVSALVYLIIASIGNIILDILFVAAVGMGVEGVAIATILSQGFSAILCAVKLSGMKDVLDFKLKYIRWNGAISKKIIALGAPSGVTQVILSMSMLMVQALNNSFGPTFLAANVIVQRIDSFAMMPAMSFGQAMTTYAGQNMGAGDLERTKNGSKQGILLAVGISAVIGALLALVGHRLAHIFTNTDEVIRLSRQLIIIIAPGYMFLSGVHCMAGVMRGAGDTMTPMWLSIIQLFGMRVPFAYILCWMTRTPELPNGRREMIFVSLLLSFVIGCIMHYLVYRRGKWKNIRLVK